MWTEEEGSVQVAERIVANISSGRKIFKFLKFLEALRKMYELKLGKKPKPKLIQVLTQASFLSAVFLYIADNIVWFANMGIIEKVVF